MKVSIIIPVYNVAPYIIRCLDSVAAQTYTGEMECLLVDDCGSDDSINIAKQWIQSYNGNIDFIIFHHSKNQGLSAARNTGIEVASGNYVYFLDSDDAITPDCIKKLTDLAVKYPDADFVMGNTVKGGQELVDHHFRDVVPEYVVGRNQIDRVLLSTTIWTANNRLINRLFLLQNELFFPIGFVHEDVYWLFFLAKHTQKAAFTNKGTYYYYCNGQSIMHDTSLTNINKRMNGYRFSINSFINNILQNGSTSRYQRQFVADIIINYLQFISSSKFSSLWIIFWRHLRLIAWTSRRKISLFRLLLFLMTMPPLCFLIRFHWWRWRVRHFVISYV